MEMMGRKVRGYKGRLCRASEGNERRLSKESGKIMEGK